MRTVRKPALLQPIHHVFKTGAVSLLSMGRGQLKFDIDITHKRANLYLALPHVLFAELMDDLHVDTK